MSLAGKQFQIVDTMDVTGIIKNTDGTTTTIFSGETSKASLDEKTDKIEIYSGIGNNRTFIMHNKKQMSMDVNIRAFDLNFLAYKNGVALDTASKGSFYIGKSVPITTHSASITGVTRIISIKNLAGQDLKILSSAPVDATGVQVAIATKTATLTFYTSYADTAVIVSYEGDAGALKDNYTINFYGNAFPKGVELLCNTVAYDEGTEAIVGDFYVDIYSALGDPDFSLAFEVGKPVEIDTKFDILVPRSLPDGTDNTVTKAIGKMVITER